MELVEAIKSRRSIRKFKDQQVPKQVLERIIEVATWAPSSMNTQPWYFTVLTGEKRDELTSIASKSFEQLQHRLRELFREKMVTFIGNFFKNFGDAPVVVVVSTDKLDQRVYQLAAVESASAAIQNLLLAAFAEGLGTCWMTGPLWVEDEVRGYLEMPPSRVLVAMIALGYPDQVPPVPPRKPREVRWMGFQT